MKNCILNIDKDCYNQLHATIGSWLIITTNLHYKDFRNSAYKPMYSVITEPSEV